MDPPLAYLKSAAVVYELEDSETQIGRGEHNDIDLQARSVSGTHARINIHPTKEVARLTDLKSTNGTFVDSIRVSDGTCDLKHGSVIRFGAGKEQYIFEFHRAPEAAPSPRTSPRSSAHRSPRAGTTTLDADRSPSRRAGLSSRSLSSAGVGAALQHPPSPPRASPPRRQGSRSPPAASPAPVSGRRKTPQERAREREQSSQDFRAFRRSVVEAQKAAEQASKAYEAGRSKSAERASASGRLGSGGRPASAGRRAKVRASDPEGFYAQRRAAEAAARRSIPHSVAFPGAGGVVVMDGSQAEDEGNGRSGPPRVRASGHTPAPQEASPAHSEALELSDSFHGMLSDGGSSTGERLPASTARSSGAPAHGPSPAPAPARGPVSAGLASASPPRALGSSRSGASVGGGSEGGMPGNVTIESFNGNLILGPSQPAAKVQAPDLPLPEAPQPPVLPPATAQGHSAEPGRVQDSWPQHVPPETAATAELAALTASLASQRATQETARVSAALQAQAEQHVTAALPNLPAPRARALSEEQQAALASTTARLDAALAAESARRSRSAADEAVAQSTGHLPLTSSLHSASAPLVGRDAPRRVQAVSPVTSDEAREALRGELLRLQAEVQSAAASAAEAEAARAAAVARAVEAESTVARMVREAEAQRPDAVAAQAVQLRAALTAARADAEAARKGLEEAQDEAAVAKRELEALRASAAAEPAASSPAGMVGDLLGAVNEARAVATATAQQAAARLLACTTRAWRGRVMARALRKWQALTQGTPVVAQLEEAGEREAALVAELAKVKGQVDSLSSTSGWGTRVLEQETQIKALQAALARRDEALERQRTVFTSRALRTAGTAAGEQLGAEAVTGTELDDAVQEAVRGWRYQKQALEAMVQERDAQIATLSKAVGAVAGGAAGGRRRGRSAERREASELLVSELLASRAREGTLAAKVGQLRDIIHRMRVDGRHALRGAGRRIGAMQRRVRRARRVLQQEYEDDISLSSAGSFMREGDGGSVGSGSSASSTSTPRRPESVLSLPSPWFGSSTVTDMDSLGRGPESSGSSADSSSGDSASASVSGSDASAASSASPLPPREAKWGGDARTVAAAAPTSAAHQPGLPTATPRPALLSMPGSVWKEYPPSPAQPPPVDPGLVQRLLRSQAASGAAPSAPPLDIAAAAPHPDWQRHGGAHVGFGTVQRAPFPPLHLSQPLPAHIASQLPHHMRGGAKS